MARGNFKVEVAWKYSVDRGFQTMQRRVEKLAADPTAMLSLVKEVMRKTILQAYRKRFLGAAKLMTGMQKELQGATYNRKATLTERVAALTLKLNSGKGDAQKIQKQIEKLVAEYAGSRVLETDAETTSKELYSDQGELIGKEETRGGAGSLSTGQFTPRMGAILNLLVMPEYMETGTTAKGDVFVGIGKISDLDLILTPSHGDPQTGGTSRFKIMWRQLEFGTGIFAKPRTRRGPTKHKTTRGTWWYGPSDVRMRRFSGLHLRGSHPANVLRQRSGLRYEGDAILFRQAFFETMQRKLFGGK